MVEQKRHAELRRAKAIPKKEESEYHHIPRVAAAAFERTATPVLKGEKETKNKTVHKLGHVALKHHIEEKIRPTSSSFNLRQTLAMDHARLQRDLVGDRNQFQSTRHLKDATKLDKRRNVYKLPQRTFGADHLDLPQTDLCFRPLSTSEMSWEEDFDADDHLSHNKPKTKALFIQTLNDRQDWEQRDQVPAEAHRSVKDRMSPFLRKTDSLWILKGRKEPKADAVLEKSHSAPTGDTKQKKTLMGLFKR